MKYSSSILLLAAVSGTSAWSAEPLFVSMPHGRRKRSLTTQHALESSSLSVAEVESWRQYVPLIVSAGVIGDILLGSPLANAALKPLRGDQDEAMDTPEQEFNEESKARVDTEALAQQAIDKANGTLELRKFLEEQKTDSDRYEEMKRKLDEEMRDLDEDLAEREKELAKRRGK